MEPCTFQSKLEKEEKSIRRKFYYTSRNVNPEETSDIFSKENFSYIRENGTLIFQEIEFSSPKNKKFQENSKNKQTNKKATLK